MNKATSMGMWLSAAIMAGCAGPVSKPMGEPPELMSRALLFEPADRARIRISPDGKQLAMLAPKNGVLNLHVASIETPDQLRAITDDSNRGVVEYYWTYRPNTLVYVQDKNGDENAHVFSVNVATGKVADLTPLDGIQARLLAVSERKPDEVMVGINDRGDKSLHDVYRVNLATGKRDRVETNEGHIGYALDNDNKVRLAYRFASSGDIEVLKRRAKGSYEPLMTIPAADNQTTSVLGFDATDRTVYLRDSRKGNTAVLASLDIESGAYAILMEDPRADVDTALTSHDHRVLAASSNRERVEWRAIAPDFAADLAALKATAPGDLAFLNMTRDGRYMVVGFGESDTPFEYYLYDRDQKRASHLMTLGSQWKGKPFARMHTRTIKARDGLDLVAYLTLPRHVDPDGDGVPSSPRPLVLNVHGGPWARDSYGLNFEHQWLANRGYAVLSVNFRGSTGYGKAFINAADRQWGKAMHDDLIDTVRWAVAQKVADPAKVAIYGGSYGGYSTLAGLTFTPDTFACGVDIVGPSNLVTLLNTIPPYWKPLMELWAQRVGDPRTEEGRGLLESRSPLNFVDRIRKPLLIAQGANDPRVKQSESDQIVQVMKAKSIPVTYVLYADEGHGFARPENIKSFYAITEAFLGQCLGGRVEPVGGDFKGANFTIPHGVEFTPGIAASLQAKGG